MKMQNMKKSETTEQIALFQWAEREKAIIPELALMYHVPNEGKRTNGGILKAAGLKKGVPDVCLPVPSGSFHALYIELKFGRNKTSEEQDAYMELLRQQGNKAAVCYSAQEAKDKILDYLNLDRPGKLHLRECLTAPWIAGKCGGVLLPGGLLFTRPHCQKCEYHTPTKAEKAIAENMAEVQGNFRNPIIKAITGLAAGNPIKGTTMEETLETINNNLVLLVKCAELDVIQASVVLSVAIDAYYAGERRKRGKEDE